MIPFAGDVFDAAWKANQRNVRLLNAWLDQPGAAQRSSRAFVSWLTAGLIAFLVLMAAWGYLQGFVVSAFSLAGFAIGAFAGSRLAPLLLAQGASSPYAPLFTFVTALIQAFAALLLFSNTIQLSAFTRRTEVGVMRLTGASRWYTQLPFLLEAVVAGVVGGLLAIVGLVIGKVAFIDRVLAGVFEAAIVPRLGYADIFSVAPILLVVGAAVAAVTGYLTLRLYVRI